MSERITTPEQRLRTFEEFEKRLMMSADPVANLLPPLDLSLPRMSAQVESVEVAPDVVSQSLTPQVQPGSQTPEAAAQQQLSTTATSSPTTDAANIAARYGFDGSGQTIAVIDTGIAWDHYALGGGFGAGSKVVGGWDFAENDANPYDDGPSGFHGTHVSGIIGSEDATYRGVSSGVDLVGLRVFDDNGGGNLQWVEQALQWVHDHKDSFEHPITTVNLSLGTMWNSTNTPDWGILEDEFAQLEMDGLFISVAAGNSFQDYNTTGLSYPAVSPYVVPVASHGSDNLISDFSQREARVLAAPGESIRSTVPDHLFGGSQSGAFLGASGTSMAAPYVAGASAVLRQAFASMGYDHVDQDTLYQQFRDTANQIYDSVTNGYYYQINLDAAIQSVINGEANVPSNGQPTGPAEPPADPPATEPAPAPPQDQPSHAANLKDGLLTIKGTDGDDSIRVDASGKDVVNVTVNGASQSFQLNSIRQILALGGNGTDSIELNLGDTADNVVTDSGALYARNDQFRFAAREVEQVDVTSDGGDDMLTLLDTTGNDQLTVEVDRATMQTGGYRSTAHGFNEIFVRSTGGHDTVSFVGSEGDEVFVLRDHRSMMRHEGLRVVVDHFRSVNFDGNGGNDHANLFGSQRNDTFELGPRSARVVTDLNELTVSNIGRLNAFSLAGHDTIRLADSAGDDFYRKIHQESTLTGDGFLNYVRGFADITVVGSGGYDLAQIDDSAGNDILSAVGNQVTLQSPNDRVTTLAFDRVNVVAKHGGFDQAFISGTVGDDNIYADVNSLSVGLSTGELNRVVNFEQTAFDGLGGTDVANLQGSSADERLTADRATIKFRSMVQMLQMVNVEDTSFDGNGGADRVVFEEFAELDLLQSIGDKATAFLANRKISAEEFSLLEARSVDDAIAEFDMEAVDYLYMLRGKWKQR